MARRLAESYYLHILSGSWQWRIEPDAVCALRDTLTHQMVAEVSAVLVVHMLAHYLGQAKLTAELLPQLEALEGVTRAPGVLDMGRRALRGVSGRRLRGYSTT